MKSLKFGFLFLGLAMLVACSDNNGRDNNDPIIKLEDISSIAAINNKMAWDLFESETSSKPQKNVLISPYRDRKSVV